MIQEGELLDLGHPLPREQWKPLLTDALPLKQKGVYVWFKPPSGATRECRVERMAAYDSGNAYHFKYAGQWEYLLAVPGTRPEPVVLTDWRGVDHLKLVFGRRANSVMAISVMGAAVPGHGENYSVLLRTHSISEANKEAYGNSGIGLGKILVIVGLVGVLVIGAIWAFKQFSPAPVPDAPVETGVTPDIPTPVGAPTPIPAPVRK